MRVSLLQRLIVGAECCAYVLDRLPAGCDVRAHQSLGIVGVGGPFSRGGRLRGHAVGIRGACGDVELLARVNEVRLGGQDRVGRLGDCGLGIAHPRSGPHEGVLGGLDFGTTLFDLSAQFEESRAFSVGIAVLETVDLCA
ncbi:MAG: hypothetical protein KDB80_00525, partial [Planctomycetes bacterium]|nr:hypothetical protein [Planctomycetota bacterium]